MKQYTHMIRLLCALLLTGLLGACATPPPVAERPAWSWPQRQQQLEQLDSWQVLGKVGIRQEGEHSSASLNWTQQAGDYRIFLAGPLGQGSVDIQGAPGAVTLNIAGEGSYEAASPEDVLYQQLGWTLPISQLHYWVRGLPAPGYAEQRTLDERNRLETLEQLGWTIHYRDYHSRPGVDLPRRLILSRGEDLRVTLVLKEWTLSPDTLSPDT